MSVFGKTLQLSCEKETRMKKLEIKRKFEFILFKNYIPGNTWKSNFKEEHQRIQFSCHVYCCRVPKEFFLLSDHC